MITSVSFDWKAKVSSNEMFNPSMVCFCDIPIEDLGIHVAKYGLFGIAFRKQYLVQRGATPVFYVARDSAKEHEPLLGAQFDANFAPLKRLHLPLHGATKEIYDRDLSQLMLFMYGHVFSYFKFFDSGEAEDGRRNFYMEREWRVLGNVEFQLADVERLLIPRAYRERLRDACPEFQGQLSFTDGHARPGTRRRKTI